MFDWNEQELLDLFWALSVPVVMLAFLIIGGVIHGLNREWRQHVKKLQVDARWSQILKEPGK